MSNFIRQLRAHEGEIVEIRWNCTDGSIFVQAVAIPQKSVREARQWAETESPGTPAAGAGRGAAEGFDLVTYVYRGDRWTAPDLKGATCEAVRRPDGKCIRGRNGSMLVRFAEGRIGVVLGRQLRKVTR